MYHFSKNKLFLYSLGLVTLTFFASCNPDNKDSNVSQVEENTQAQMEPNENAAMGQIAYVNIDSLEAHYEYFKNKKIEFEKKQLAADNELQRMSSQFQNKLAEFQQKAQAGTLTQTEGEQAERELAQMQQNFEKRQQNLGEELMKQQEEFSKELKRRLDSFLETYNADKKFSYILSYAEGGSILFADKNFDITDDVIKGMNEEQKESK